MTRNTLPLIVIVSLALPIGACDSSNENARQQTLENKADRLEDQADATEAHGEAHADAIERRDPGVDDPATDRAAEQVRDSSGRRADSLENQADQVRDKK